MEQSTVVVGWFTLAVLTAGIAQGKNRSGFNWFFLGMLLNPFALVCLVVLFDKQQRMGD